MATPTTTLSRVAVFLTVLALAIFILLAAGVQAGDEVRPTETHVVGQGETLWDIAAEFTAPGGDVRETLYDIRTMNRIEGSVISIGQAVIVPSG